MEEKCYSVLLAYPDFRHTYYAFTRGFSFFDAVRTVRQWAADDCDGEYSANSFVLLAAMEGRIDLGLTIYEQDLTLI